jgi:hypothetical protein
MASTLLLNASTWDLVLDAFGNIAVATEPYALAQDAASAIKTFLGECWWDTTVGVPWLQQVLGQGFSLPVLKQLLTAAAKTVPDVTAATVFISSYSPVTRIVTGQVQITSSTGQTAAANFSSPPPFAVVNPQGAG